MLLPVSKPSLSSSSTLTNVQACEGPVWCPAVCSTKNSPPGLIWTLGFAERRARHGFTDDASDAREDGIVTQLCASATGSSASAAVVRVRSGSAAPPPRSCVRAAPARSSAVDGGVAVRAPAFAAPAESSPATSASLPSRRRSRRALHGQKERALSPALLAHVCGVAALLPGQRVASVSRNVQNSPALAVEKKGAAIASHVPRSGVLHK